MPFVWSHRGTRTSRDDPCSFIILFGVKRKIFEEYNENCTIYFVNRKLTGSKSP